MFKRYFFSFSITFILYISFIVLYIFNIDTIFSKPLSASKIDNTIVKFSVISIPTPTSKKNDEKQIEDKIIKKNPKKLESKSKEIVKKEPVNSKKIEKQVEKKIVKKIEKELKPISKEIVKEIKKIKPKEIVKNYVEKKISQNKVATAPTKSKHIEEEKKDFTKERDIYYSHIKNHLNKNKKYPKTALRRGIEDDVQIKFLLSKNGELLNYKILNGKKIFYDSIKDILYSTFPLKPTNKIFDKDINLTLTLSYRIV